MERNRGRKKMIYILAWISGFIVGFGVCAVVKELKRRGLVK